MQNTKKMYQITIHRNQLIVCLLNMLALVDKKFGEKPYMSGDGVAAATDGTQYIKTQLVIAVNIETKTFSIVEFIGGNLTCIVASGSNFRLNDIKGEKKTNIVLEN